MKSSYGGSTYSFGKPKKPTKVVIDISKDNLVEVNELKTASKGFAQKMSLKRNREKVYYGLWKKAFETAVKAIADKKGSMVRSILH